VDGFEFGMQVGSPEQEMLLKSFIKDIRSVENGRNGASSPCNWSIFFKKSSSMLQPDPQFTQ